MILRYGYLSRHPRVFLTMTGLPIIVFDELVRDLLPAYVAADQARLNRPSRQRAIGGGHPFALCPRDQLLLTVVWLRQYPTQEALGYFFGVSDTGARAVIERVLPLLEAAGRDTMRLPDPGRKRRRHADVLLADIPALTVLVDSFEQRVQRPAVGQKEYYSGKKKAHTVKVQVAVDPETGKIVDVSESVPGPTADITLLERSGLCKRVPPEGGIGGDKGYRGIDKLHGGGATPRRKPRDQEQSEEDKAYNRAFARAHHRRARHPARASLRMPEPDGPALPRHAHGARARRGWFGQPSPRPPTTAPGGVIRSQGRGPCVSPPIPKMNYWFVTLVAHQEIEDKPKAILTEENTIGLDLGLKDACVTSEGKIIPALRSYRKTQVRRRKAARVVSRRKGAKKREKPSNRFKKAKAKAARIDRKAANQRADFLHKLSTGLVQDHDGIVIEDLSVKGLGKTNLAKSVFDAGMGLFRRMLEYKADRGSRTIIVIDRWFPSSRLCSVNGCDYRTQVLTLGDRVWTCPQCGTIHHRDVNAARNIEAEGLRIYRTWAQDQSPLDRGVVAAGQVETLNARGCCVSFPNGSSGRNTDVVGQKRESHEL